MREQYGIGSLDYLERSRALCQSQDLESLFHAAFELRCALERTPFDYLVMISGGEQAKVMKHPGKYKPKDVFALARDVDPEVEKKLHFACLVLRSLGHGVEAEAVDLGFLAQAHRECGQYLHAQKDPTATVEDPEWVDRLREFLVETGDRLLAMWRANRAVMVNLSSSGEATWQLFKSGKYSDDQIVTMLRLAES